MTHTGHPQRRFAHANGISTLLSVLVLAVMISACGDDGGSGSGSSGGGEAATNGAGRTDTIKIALAPFQDALGVASVGMAKGFYERHGIELEVAHTDFAGMQELLIGNQTDIAYSTVADIVRANAQGHDVTMAVPCTYFAGIAFMYMPEEHGDWKTYDDFVGAGDDQTTAARNTLLQLKDAKIGISEAGGEIGTFAEMLRIAGLDPKDFNTIDLTDDDLPAALLSGSIDIMISGLPQRIAVTKRGAASVIDQVAFPTTVIHAFYSARREWIDKNTDLYNRFYAATMETMDYINSNPDEAFPIISQEMEKQGTAMAVEDLETIWNKAQFFPNNKADLERDLVAPDGKFYWEDNYKAVIEGLKKTDNITDATTPLPDLNYAVKLLPTLTLE